MLEGITVSSKCEFSVLDEGTGSSLQPWTRCFNSYRCNGWPRRLAFNLVRHFRHLRICTLLFERLSMIINVLNAASIRFFIIHYLHLFQLDLFEFLFNHFALFLDLFLALKAFSGEIRVVILSLPPLLFIINRLQVLLELAHYI